MAATLALDDQQPTVGFTFIAVGKKEDGQNYQEKTSREKISLVLSNATALKAALEEKWSSALFESVIL